MNEILLKIINYVSINFLSIIALGVSIFNLIYYLIKNKKKLDIVVNCYTTGYVNEKVFYMYDVNFINRSQLSISINGLKINDNKKDYYIIKSPRKLFESNSKINNQIINYKEINSVTFPINLQGFESSHNFIIMYGPDKFENDIQKVIISTSRGNIKKKINLGIKHITTEEFMQNEKFYCK